MSKKKAINIFLCVEKNATRNRRCFRLDSSIKTDFFRIASWQRSEKRCKLIVVYVSLKSTASDGAWKVEKQRFVMRWGLMSVAGWNFIKFRRLYASSVSVVRFQSNFSLVAWLWSCLKENTKFYVFWVIVWSSSESFLKLFLRKSVFWNFRVMKANNWKFHPETKLFEILFKKKLKIILKIKQFYLFIFLKKIVWDR